MFSKKLLIIFITTNALLIIATAFVYKGIVTDYNDYLKTNYSRYTNDDYGVSFLYPRASSLVDQTENNLNLYLYFDVTTKFCAGENGGHYINISSFNGDLSTIEKEILSLPKVELETNKVDNQTIFTYSFNQGDTRFYKKDVYLKKSDNQYIQASFIKPIINGHCFYEVRYRVTNEDREKIFNDLLKSIKLY